MTPARIAALVFAALIPPLAFRLGGAALWGTLLLGVGIAAALAAWELHRDGLLQDVLRPQGFDLTAGVLPALGLYLVLAMLWQHWIAPDELGGILRKCNLDGPRVPRTGVHGITVLAEWLRGELCRGYGISLGLLGTPRAVAVLAMALFEELAWRGGVQQGLSERFGSTRGWILAAVLYAFSHLLTGQIALTGLALGCGLLWGALYRFRGRLAPAIISHALFSYTLFHARPLADFH